MAENENEQARCQNPNCGLPIVVIAGHRRRQYCDNACKMAAHRARLEAVNQARYEALQLEIAQREREELRRRWGDLLPETVDLLRHLRTTYGIMVADQVAGAITAERDFSRKSMFEERCMLIDAILLAGEQLDFPIMIAEAFELQPGVFAWHAFCENANLEHLRLVRDTVHLKLQAKRGRNKLAHLASQS